MIIRVFNRTAKNWEEEAMIKLSNELNTMKLFIGTIEEIMNLQDPFLKTQKSMRQQFVFDYQFPMKNEETGEMEESLALLADLHYVTFVEVFRINDTIRRNHLRVYKDIEKIPQNSRDWAIALSECMKIGKHGRCKGVSRLLKIFGNGQPCGLVSVQGEYLGEDVVSEAKAEALIYMGVLPIPMKDDLYNVEHFAQAWTKINREGCMTWGLHDPVGTH